MDKSGDLNDVVQTIKELEESRNMYMCENQELANTIDDLEDEMDEAENINQADMEQIDEQEMTIHNLTRNNKNLTNVVHNKNLEIAELRGYYKDLEELRRKNDNLEKDLMYCEIQTKKLKDAIRKLEESIQEKDNNIIRQVNQMDRLERHCAQFNKTIEALEEEIECLMRRNEECRKKLDDIIVENVRLMEKIKQCEMIRQKLGECNKKLLVQIKQLKNQLVKETATGAKLTNKINGLEDDNNRAKREIAQLREEIMGLNEELDDQQSEIDKCRNELKRKIQEFENYKITISSVKEQIMNNRNNIPVCRNPRSHTRRPRRYQSQPATFSCGSRYRSMSSENSTSVCMFKSKMMKFDDDVCVGIRSLRRKPCCCYYTD